MFDPQTLCKDATYVIMNEIGQWRYSRIARSGNAKRYLFYRIGNKQHTKSLSERQVTESNTKKMGRLNTGTRIDPTINRRASKPAHFLGDKLVKERVWQDITGTTFTLHLSHLESFAEVSHGTSFPTFSQKGCSNVSESSLEA